MASKKASGGSRKKAGVTVEHTTELHLELDAEKIAAIKRCMEKGALKISVSKLNLATGGRAGGGYEYD